MEWREKQYDHKVFADLHDRQGHVSVSRTLTYVATDSKRNSNWAGPASLEEMGKQIALSHGPSGPNHEYLFLLADGLRKVRRLTLEV